MLLGIGIAMTMSPMTSAAMNAVPVQKAGIASGVLSMFRMVGGSLGVAVTGAIFQGLVGSLDPPDGSASPAAVRLRARRAMTVARGRRRLGAGVGAFAIRAKAKARRLEVEAAEAASTPAARRSPPRRR